MASIVKKDQKQLPKINKVKVAPPAYFEEEISRQNIEQQILDAKKLFDNKIDIETYLSINKDLNSKRTVERYRPNQLEVLSAKFQEEISTELESNNEIKDLIQEAIKLITSRKWNEATNLIKKLDHADVGYWSILIQICLNLDANINFIASLLDRGGVLPSSAIHHFIYNGNLNAIKKFIPYGLSLDYIDLLGRTVIKNSVILKQISILKYLLDNGMFTKQPHLGFDALNLAIRDFDMASEGIMYLHFCEQEPTSIILIDT
ncbi:MAG: ankyrin repeat domain-containing protein [Psychrobium sp.]|nr:ankyrin repeat domain-containing protein [Psychrobium sp.]